MIEVPMSVTFSDGDAQYEDLDLYYGSKAMEGTSSTVLLTSHAVLNKTVVKQTPSAKGMRGVFKLSHDGSFKQDFVLQIYGEKQINTYNTLGRIAFKQLLTQHIRMSLGLSEIELSARARSWFMHEMSGADVLFNRLKNPLYMMHKSIENQGHSVSLIVSGDRIASLTSRTLDYLKAEIPDQDRVVLDLAVSRFNVRTGTGRFIFDYESDSTSFSSQLWRAFNPTQIHALATSLERLARGVFSPIRAEVTRVMTIHGDLKHYVLHQVII